MTIENNKNKEDKEERNRSDKESKLQKPQKPEPPALVKVSEFGEELKGVEIIIKSTDK